MINDLDTRFLEEKNHAPVRLCVHFAFGILNIPYPSRGGVASWPAEQARRLRVE
jgi:hypothetical protein